MVTRAAQVRIVLNKADQVDSQHLMRVYGALMWSLSRIFKAPEVPRVYTSNFQEGEFVHKEFEALMNRERTKVGKPARLFPPLPSHSCLPLPSCLVLP